MKTDAQWEKIGKKSHHGIAVPLFSLRTKKSCGIGEFLDLIPLIDFCASVGLTVIQLLPINDTGRDPSPYNALSSCALDPIYLSLPGDTSTFTTLNNLTRIDYEAVRLQKKEWLREHFLHNFNPDDPAYKQFLEEHSSWLHSYARFKAYKDQYNHAHFKNWPKEPECSPEAIDFYSYLQFLCFQQLNQVKKYAEEKSISIMGDIPILISPDSADVWAEPELFDLTLEAGAPPDQYNPNGQHWGFPLFKWEVMRQRHFVWWKRRLSVATLFFHIYRIDHVVGLFRMWAIQTAPNGELIGQFFPGDRSLWESQGGEILQMMIESSPMLPIAEDLGGKTEEFDTLADCVRPLLKSFGICGTRVLRWERRWHAHKKFIPYDEYEPFSLSTVSTHDSEPLNLWWSAHPFEAQDFAHFKDWPYQPTLFIEQRIEILKDSHHTSSFFHINPIQEYLSLFPEFAHENPEDERINIPGTISPQNWTYRLKPTLEEILPHKPLADLFKKLIST